MGSSASYRTWCAFRGKNSNFGRSNAISARGRALRTPCVKPFVPPIAFHSSAECGPSLTNVFMVDQLLRFKSRFQQRTGVAKNERALGTLYVLNGMNWVQVNR